MACEDEWTKRIDREDLVQWNKGKNDVVLVAKVDLKNGDRWIWQVISDGKLIEETNAFDYPENLLPNKEKAIDYAQNLMKKSKLEDTV